MKLNDMLYELLDLAKQENEPNRFAHSEEYNKLYDELDTKTLIVDEIEKVLGCPLNVLGKALKNGIYRYNRNYEPKFRKHQVLYLGKENGRYCIKWLGEWSEYLDDYKKTWWLKENKEE